MSVSADLLWGIIRNNNCFLLKGNGQTYSREPNNLKAKNSFRYSGLVHKKTVGLEPCKDGKGVTLITRNIRNQGKPAKTYTKVELKKGGRKTLATVRQTVRKSRYRKDLKMIYMPLSDEKKNGNRTWEEQAAVRRASAILKSQKPVAVRKTVRKRKD